MHMLRSFLKCERGATAIEYAIIAGSIAVVIVAAVKLIDLIQIVVEALDVDCQRHSAVEN